MLRTRRPSRISKKICEICGAFKNTPEHKRTFWVCKERILIRNIAHAEHKAELNTILEDVGSMRHISYIHDLIDFRNNEVELHEHILRKEKKRFEKLQKEYERKQLKNQMELESVQVEGKNNSNTSKPSVEYYLRDAFTERYPEDKFIFDKVISEESRTRPDIYIALSEHIVIIECDENQHKNYKNELTRLSDLKYVLMKQIWVIRFNPDSYIDATGKRIPGCFNRKRKVLRKDIWETRLNTLFEHYEKCKSTRPRNGMTVIKLFYDENVE